MGGRIRKLCIANNRNQNPNVRRSSSFRRRLPLRIFFLRLRCLQGLAIADRLGSMLLKKSFYIGDQNFLWLYTRFSCNDAGDLIA